MCFSNRSMERHSQLVDACGTSNLTAVSTNHTTEALIFNDITQNLQIDVCTATEVCFNLIMNITTSCGYYGLSSCEYKKKTHNVSMDYGE